MFSAALERGPGREIFAGTAKLTRQICHIPEIFA
jgi:hypothetical protein